jgi:hypothetical protein
MISPPRDLSEDLTLFGCREAQLTPICSHFFSINIGKIDQISSGKHFYVVKVIGGGIKRRG